MYTKMLQHQYRMLMNPKGQNYASDTVCKNWGLDVRSLTYYTCIITLTQPNLTFKIQKLEYLNLYPKVQPFTFIF